MRSVPVSPPPDPARAVGSNGAPPRRQTDARCDEAFLRLLADYRASGGLAPGAEIAARAPEAGFLPLARMIAGRQVISFEWNDEFWLPVFQFDRGGQTVASTVQLLLSELTPVLDEWALAEWFVEPNALLAHRVPLALLDSHFNEVHDAARSLRFTHCI